MNNELQVWVLHSPYPDGTWRGVEKCVTTQDSNLPLLFESEQEALDFKSKHELEEMTPVLVRLVVPFVRRNINSTSV